VSERPDIVGVSLRDTIPLAERAVYDASVSERPTYVSGA